ncbi:hypothetical protein Dsin_014536 [Dipteronia sinensis]|uniref:FMN-dependent dehydrogenase domain-containing protein n=1 Tax=Dipteronia sinensis TaxID=43782 RepID=A0AAE0EA05_9ROSI|nr:hypothetical protein Dsin_014536 [Dipteronia sinensis]
MLMQVGRPVVYGLAAKEEYGVRRVLEMLKDEFELTMTLSGLFKHEGYYQTPYTVLPESSNLPSMRRKIL